jgi:hypothetical protein
MKNNILKESGVIQNLQEIIKKETAEKGGGMR